LLIELNPWTATAAGRSTAELMECLVSLGYRSFASMETFPRTIRVDELALDRQSNVLAQF
jgi:hypothetical protein